MKSNALKKGCLILFSTCIYSNLQAVVMPIGNQSACNFIPPAKTYSFSEYEFNCFDNQIESDDNSEDAAPVSLEQVSQTNRLFSFSLRNVTLKDVFRKIESQSSFMFMYTESTFDEKKLVSISVQNATIEEVLKKLFASSNVEYSISHKQILLKDVSKEQSSPDRLFVKGVVKDENDLPLIGATVVVEGDSSGTITDVNGCFQLKVSAGSVLQIFYLGYQTQTVRATTHVLEVVLKEDAKMLEELVVVGYGTQKRASLSSAVAVIRGENIVQRPVVNSAMLLQGQVPGLHVSQDTGQPGAENVAFRIRGQGTFSVAGSNPLVLINGIEGNITNLDPNMIESVSVLKDAASASIYGSRAANGVILVTTKEGTGEGDNTAHFSYHGYLGVYTPINMYKLVTNSAEYMELFNLAKTNSGKSGLYTQEMIDLYRNDTDRVKYPNFDWLDYMFRSVVVQNHNLSIAGNAGKERKTSYHISLNFVNQPGIMKGFEYKKYNMTWNLTSEVNKFIKVGAYSSMQYGDRQELRYGQRDAILSTLSQAPTYMPWLPDDGSGVRKWTNKAYNFEGRNKNIAAVLGERWFKTYRNFDINTQAWLNIKLFKGLNWYTKAAVRLRSNKMKDWSTMVNIYDYHTGQVNGKIGAMGLTDSDARNLYTNLYSYLNYEVNTANNVHDLSLMAGYSIENEKNEGLSAYRKEFLFDLPVLNAGSKENWSNSGSESEWAMMSVFGRFRYSFKERYLFEANVRYDGTSRIVDENRWGIFPSFSGAWRLTEEKFIKDLNLKWLNNAKIRGSWGQLGNQNIGLYPYQSVIVHVADYPFDKNNTSMGYIQTSYANRNIKWETTTITDIGADVTLFNGLNITFDWYNKQTTDILRASQVSGLLGMGAPTVNSGEVRNRGVELAINYSKRISKGFLNKLHYSIGGYVDSNRNELVKFGAEEIGSFHIRREGLPYNSYFMLECTGVFANQAEVDGAPKQFNDRTLPGDLRYKDQNADGVINNDDRVPMGGQFSNFEYGFNMSSDWHGIDLSVLTQGVSGKSYYTTNWGVSPFHMGQGSAPTHDYVKGMWTEENPYNARHPRIYYGDMGGPKNNRPNSYFLRNASYYRIKNITLGYTFPKIWTKKFNMSKLRVYFSGENLLTFTNYTGLDPERGGDGTEAQYPQNKIYAFGLNVEF